jgi:L-fuconate dehydratase
VPVITSLDVFDIRFPTSASLDGSDAMFTDPDYSAAYVVIRADGGLEGFGLVFTIGRGNDIQVEAIRALERHVVGFDVARLRDDPGALYRTLKSDSQLRWLGPEKGIIQMAIGAVVNATWDLLSREAGKPMWKYLCDLTPEQLVDATDLTYLTDVITPDDALQLLRDKRRGAREREARIVAEGVPAYTTGAGWLGYDDEKLARLVGEAVSDGFNLLKLKVGLDRHRDAHRLGIARSIAPDSVRIAVDANQSWDVPQAIESIRALAPFDPYWIEEPTSPDDILGHATIRAAVHPIKVATGEHACNRVVFKQLLQADAIDVLQLDATRVGGVSEHLAILLLAARFDVPVVPHAGGVGLCEMVQHLAMFDAVSVAGDRDDRMIEYVDHLHEHFVDPAHVERGAYVVPESPGFGARMHDASVEEFLFPISPFWRSQAHTQ